MNIEEKRKIEEMYEKGLVEISSIIEPLIENFKIDRCSIDIQQCQLVIDYLIRDRDFDENYIQQLEEELEKEKEKNKKIDEFCRKELAFERRLKRENRQPDEFNQGRFYVSENIRKIIEEE